MTQNPSKKLAGITMTKWIVAEAQTLYASVDHITYLLHTEAELVRILQTHIQNQEHQLQLVRRLASWYSKEYEEAIQDAEGYVSNPIKAYLLLRGLTFDWTNVKMLMERNTGEGLLHDIAVLQRTMTLPSNYDLLGAIYAILRIQDTYNLTTTSFAKGQLNDTHYNAELSAGDCFEIGFQLFNVKDYHHAVPWLTEALHRYDEEYIKTVTKSDILQYLSYSAYEQGNIQTAYDLMDELLTETPSHEQAPYTNAYYKSFIRRTYNGQRMEVGEDKSNNMKSIQQVIYDKEIYHMNCRFQQLKPIIATSRLKCQYTDKGIAFLRLGSLKAEELSTEPQITMYHDVIYDTEIEMLTQLSLHKLVPANADGHPTGVADYRVAKTAWFEDINSSIVASVNRRAAYIAGLSLINAEPLQIVNYGIGGHYDPHYDFFMEGEKSSIYDTNNRIATVLFYLNDVEQGGATVFPLLNISVKPEKGAALVWYNLHRNGERDWITIHGACPVLVGSKWALNKWFHLNGQEFRRPCALTLDQLEKCMEV